MRTIEEIKKELQGITCITETPGQFPFLDHELRVQKLIDELIAAQDAEIARLRDHFTWKLTKSEPDDETMVYLTFCVAGKPYYFPLPPPPELKEEEENDHAND
ncbi:MAG TPA: hypothetical protein PK572_09570 [Kiritimatiellia bacterium]|nr:hypothetical protein [Kiritimatiellia bacterium]